MSLCHTRFNDGLHLHSMLATHMTLIYRQFHGPIRPEGRDSLDLETAAMEDTNRETFCDGNHVLNKGLFSHQSFVPGCQTRKLSRRTSTIAGGIFCDSVHSASKRLLNITGYWNSCNVELLRLAKVQNEEDKI